MAVSVRNALQWRTRGICRETIALGSVCLLDLALTVYLLATDQAWEANPLMAHFLQYGLLGFCLAKLLFVIPPLLVAEWYRAYNDRLVRGTLRAVTIAYVAIWVVATALLNAPSL